MFISNEERQQGQRSDDSTTRAVSAGRMLPSPVCLNREKSCCAL